MPADVLVQRAAVTDEPRTVLAEFLESGLPETMLDSPFLLVGGEDELLAKLRRLEEAGVEGVTVFARDADAMAPVFARHRSPGPNP